VKGERLHGHGAKVERMPTPSLGLPHVAIPDLGGLMARYVKDPLFTLWLADARELVRVAEGLGPWLAPMVEAARGAVWLAPGPPRAAAPPGWSPTVAEDAATYLQSKDPEARLAALQRLATVHVTPASITPWDTTKVDDEWVARVAPIIATALEGGELPLGWLAMDGKRLAEYVGARLIGQRYRPRAKAGKPIGSGTYPNPQAFRDHMLRLRKATGPGIAFTQVLVLGYLAQGPDPDSAPDYKTLRRWTNNAGFRDWQEVVEWVDAQCKP